jgi:hypothetical protein
MPERYFEKFPIVNYSNNNVVDITRRTVILERVSNNPYVFYPYELSDEERADQFSSRYYNDSYKSWVIYLTNKITDPYYEWYLTETQLIDFLNKKYGSYFTAQQKIKEYKNNWENQNQIEVGRYNSLTPGQKRYWEPVYGSGAIVLSYKRREVNWLASTNKIVSYSLSSNTTFTNDEICDIVFDNNNTGKGQVIGQPSSNTVLLQHVYGTYDISNTVSITGSSYIYGSESNSNTTFTSLNILSNTIEDEEFVYWTPVTYYDYEIARNEFNKTIRVLESDLSSIAANNLRDLLRE